MNDHKVCGNCKYWNQLYSVFVTLPDSSAEHGLASRWLAPCLWHSGTGLGAVEPDAGFGAVVLLGPESHCRCMPMRGNLPKTSGRSRQKKTTTACAPAWTSRPRSSAPSMLSRITPPPEALQRRAAAMILEGERYADVDDGL